MRKLHQSIDAEIREAYLNLVRLLHPDAHREKDLDRFAESQIKRISRAYGVLSDADRRLRYDAELGRNGAPAVASPRPRKSLSARAFITMGC